MDKYTIFVSRRFFQPVELSEYDGKSLFRMQDRTGSGFNDARSTGKWICLVM